MDKKPNKCPDTSSKLNGCSTNDNVVHRDEQQSTNQPISAQTGTAADTLSGGSRDAGVEQTDHNPMTNVGNNGERVLNNPSLGDQCVPDLLAKTVPHVAQTAVRNNPEGANANDNYTPTPPAPYRQANFRNQIKIPHDKLESIIAIQTRSSEDDDEDFDGEVPDYVEPAKKPEDIDDAVDKLAHEIVDVRLNVKR